MNEKWHVGWIRDSVSNKCTSKRDISKFLTIRHHCFNHSPVWATVHVFSVIFLQHHMSSIEWTGGQLTSSEVLQCNTEVIFWYTQDKHHPTEQKIKIQNLSHKFIWRMMMIDVITSELSHWQFFCERWSPLTDRHNS